ncbi:MAG TPA: family 1 encapsulin nanocompartment shell protein [Herpetosiphonaceae bacterium]|nr:family 1 encapsulin nanocompartment shell protein [Herpetosiphonaceae bacterium]
MIMDRNSLNWGTDSRQRINSMVHDEAARIRVARRVLPLFGNSNGYVDSIIGHAVNVIAAAAPNPATLAIAAGQNLVPVDIWVEFLLRPEQFNDELVVAALATRAAYQLALAEDAAVLLGPNANLGRFDASDRNLAQQPALFQPGQAAIGQPILQSILAGIAALRANNHHGPYCAIVAPDLYQQAFAPRRRIVDAPIHEIRPLLRDDDGFQYSAAAPAGTGIIMSLGGHTIDMAVPVDAMVEPINDERGATRLRVVEQIRLRVNDPAAVVPLA